MNVPALFRTLAAAALAGAALAASAATGLTTLPETAEDGPVTVWYPTDQPPTAYMRGSMRFDLTVDAPPAAGNGRLVVISHGSGGSPWVHGNLAQALVAAGFVVAMPEHRDDNYRHDGHPGPRSWKLRPAEVSRAIDAIGRDPRFAPRLALDRVGMYGMSAGGHTALTLAGGQWSPARFAAHCEAHIAEDFYTCVGLALRQTGGLFDGLKRGLALAVLRAKFGGDTAPQAHTDPRIAAIVASVPLAADFDLDTLKSPRVPLALVTAGQDRWLVPRFHSDAVLAACRTCEHLAHLPDGGHGALLSPLPPGFTGLVGELLNDPPGFDRAQLPAVDRQITGFFVRHLGPAPAPL